VALVRTLRPNVRRLALTLSLEELTFLDNRRNSLIMNRNGILGNHSGYDALNSSRVFRTFRCDQGIIFSRCIRPTRMPGAILCCEANSRISVAVVRKYSVSTAGRVFSTEEEHPVYNFRHSSLTLREALNTDSGERC
jgi:hypothetical protein